jgi:hypothetical protein
MTEGDLSADLMDGLVTAFLESQDEDAGPKFPESAFTLSRNTESLDSRDHFAGAQKRSSPVQEALKCTNFRYLHGGVRRHQSHGVSVMKLVPMEYPPVVDLTSSPGRSIADVDACPHDAIKVEESDEAEMDESVLKDTCHETAVGGATSCPDAKRHKLDNDFLTRRTESHGRDEDDLSVGGRPFHIPDYKFLQGTTFVVDAFRWGKISNITGYFLSYVFTGVVSLL